MARLYKYGCKIKTAMHKNKKIDFNNLSIINI